MIKWVVSVGFCRSFARISLPLESSRIWLLTLDDAAGNALIDSLALAAQIGVIGWHSCSVGRNDRFAQTARIRRAPVKGFVNLFTRYPLTN